MIRRPWKIFRERMLGGFAWNVLAAGSTQGSLFLTHLIVARLLGVSEFGRYALLLTTAMAISSIAQSGVGFVAAKYVAEFHLVDKDRAGRILSLCRFAALAVGVASSLVLILGAEWLATTAFGHPDMAYGLKIIGFSVPFLALNAYQQGALQGFGEFRRSGIVGAVAGVIHVLLVAAGGAVWGLPGVLFALVFSSALRTVAFTIALSAAQARHLVRSPFGGFRQDLHLLWRAGLPSTVMGASFAMAFWLVSLILARGPGGTDAVAHFYAANQIRLLALQAPTILSGVSVSLLNRLRGEADWNAYRGVFRAYISANMVMACTLAAIGAFMASPLMSIYGADFAQHHRLLQVMVLSVIPEVAAIALYVHVQAHERLWSSLLHAWLPKDAVFVIGTWLALTPGPIGAAVSYSLSWLLAAVVLGFAVARLGMGQPAARFDRAR
jgi:O-antigen/teichoic acid export membrane protein